MSYQGQINFNPAATLAQFVNPADRAVKALDRYSTQLREDEKYAAEQARIKVADDRAKITWDQGQKVIQDAKNQSMAASKFYQLPDESTSVATTVLPAPTQVQVGATTVPVSGSGAEAGTSGRYVTTKGTPGRVIPGVQQEGHYADKNPKILFKATETVPGAPIPYVEGPMTSTRKHKIEAVNAKYDTTMEPLREKLRQTYDGSAFGGQGKQIFNDTASHITGLQNKRDLEIKEIMRDKSVASKGPSTTKITTRSTNLDDIDQSKVYNSDGTPVLPNQAPKGRDLYMATKQERKLVNIQNIGTAVQNSYVPGAKTADTWKDGTPDNIKYIAGTSAKTIPTSSTSESGKVTSGSVPTEKVVAAVNNAANSFASIVQSAGPTTAEQVSSYANRMTAFVMKEYPDLDFMAVSKMSIEAAKMRIPDGSMTAKETAVMNAKANDLTRANTVSDTLQNHGWNVEAAKVANRNQIALEGMRNANDIAKLNLKERFDLRRDALTTGGKFADETYTYTKGGKEYQVTAKSQAQLDDFAARFGSKDANGKMILDKHTGLPSNFALGNNVTKAPTGTKSYGVDRTILPSFEPFDNAYRIQMARKINAKNPHISLDNALKILESGSAENKFLDRRDDSEINAMLIAQGLKGL